jgi:hypothetical protein
MSNVCEIGLAVDNENGSAAAATRATMTIAANSAAKYNLTDMTDLSALTNRTDATISSSVVLQALSWVLAALVMGASAARAQAPLPAWMAGCWERRTASTVITEQWSQPRAGMMLGSGHTTRRDSTLEFEHTRIVRRGEALVYVAQPGGQAATEFIANAPSDSLLIFANPEHDFPQRVIYRKRGVDSLLARVEGSHGGTVRGVDFPYTRVACHLP